MLWSQKSVDAPHRQSRPTIRARSTRTCTSRARTRRCGSACRPTSAYARAVARAARADPRQPADAARPHLIDRSGEIASAASRAIYENDVPAVFAAVDDPALQRELRRRRTTAPPPRCVTLDAWFEAQTPARRRRTSRSAPSDSARCSDATERVDTPLDELEAHRRADLARNLAALTRGVRALRAGRERARSACEKMNDAQAARRTRVDAARRAARRAAARSSCEHEAGHDPRHRGGAGAASRRRTSAGTSPTSDPRAVRERAAVDLLHRAARSGVDAEKQQADYIPGEADLLFTSVHEVWPGHFLQFLHANRVALAVRPLVRRLRLRRGLGALHRGDDVGRGPAARRSRGAHRPAHQRAAARRALPLAHRPAHARHDASPSPSSMFREQALPGARQRASSRRRAAPSTRRTSTTRWAS